MLFQGEIEVSAGKIRRIQPGFQHCIIRTDREVYRFENAWILPGLVDAHIHLVGLGEAMAALTDLSRCSTAEDCVAHLQRHPRGRGEWLLGRGWDQHRWEKPVFPTAHLLDAAFPDHPVFLLRSDGHAAWVNTVALQRAGITARTPDPPGGKIIRDTQGAPTGVLIDEAMELVRNLIPPPSAEEIRQYIRTAMEYLNTFGVTEVHDMDVAPEWIPVFQHLAEQGELSIRIQAYIRGQHEEWLQARLLPARGEFFQLIGVKLYADGALGSYGAALRTPYADNPETTGLLLLDETNILERLGWIVEVEWDVAIHAIGDLAVHKVLNWYETLRREHIADPATRLRIEHAQIIAPEDLPRFAEHDILPSIQPLHCLVDAPMAIQRLGDRLRFAYPWRSLRNAGTIFGAGSDAPVVPPNPWEGMQAFIDRHPPGWETPLFAEERLTIDEALLAYTEWAHQLTNMHIRRGKLRENFDADFIVVDQNPLQTRQPAALNVLATFVGGECVYRSAASDSIQQSPTEVP